MPRAVHGFGAVLVAVLALFAYCAAPVSAQVACGDTVGPGEKVTLTADVGPCASGTDPAVRVIGPATLDMAGFRVLCDIKDPPTGVLVEGKGAKVMRGGADGCSDGIRLDGEGKHKVEDFVSTRNNEGFQINSDKNKLKRVAAVESGDDGFDVEGEGNKIEDAEAAGSTGGEGFEVDGNGNSFKRIAASGNEDDGIDVAGSNNKIKECRLTHNDGDGADLPGDGNKLEKCLASGNGDGDLDDAGFEIDGSGNQIKKSQSFANAGHGFRARAGSANNTFKQNVALGHEDDVLEDNTACGTNTWQKNKFGTSEADGVTDPACIE